MRLYNCIPICHTVSLHELSTVGSGCEHAKIIIVQLYQVNSMQSCKQLCIHSTQIQVPCVHVAAY